MEYKKVKLEEICKVNQGLQIPISKRFKENGKNRYFYITIQFLKGNTEDYYIENPKPSVICNKDDILVVRTGNTGIVLTNVEGCFHNNFFKVVPNDNVYPKYLYYALNNKDMYKKMLNAASGTTIPDLKHSDFYQLEICLPNMKEQKKIANILSTIDKKIELNNKINNNLLEIGKHCFKRWLENCNEEKYIYEIAEEIIDYEKNSNSKVKLLNSSDITENIFPKVEYVENKNLKGHFKKRFKKHDILYSQIRPNNHHFGYSLLENCEEYLISTRFMVVRNKPSLVSSSLLYFYLTSDKAIRDFTAKTESRSGTFPQGNFEDLSSYRVKYSANQIQITNILDKVLNKFYKNNIENELLEEIRDTLLPKLMNGEIDLDKIKI